MICYLRSSNISNYDLEIVRQDLLEMVLSAQKRGENIQSVISGEYKSFCDDIITNLPSKTIKQKIIDYCNIVCCGLSVLL